MTLASTFQQTIDQRERRDNGDDNDIRKKHEYATTGVVSYYLLLFLAHLTK